MKIADIKKFIAAAQVDVSYNESRKADFARMAKAVLREIAKAMNLEKGTYDIRYNAGGIAVSGEATLHTDNVYIQFAQCHGGLSDQFMWRTCKGRRDYGGGMNRWAKWDVLLDIPLFVSKICAVIAAPNQVETAWLAS